MLINVWKVISFGNINIDKVFQETGQKVLLITIQIENYAGTHLVILQFDNLKAEFILI